jgi:hypothetical protein
MTARYVVTPATIPAMPNAPGTPRRTIRVTDELWDATQANAAARGETVSDVARRAFEAYNADADLTDPKHWNGFRVILDPSLAPGTFRIADRTFRVGDSGEIEEPTDG